MPAPFPAIPPVSPAHNPLTSGLLAQLAAITGCDFDHERTRIAIQNASRTGSEPLSQLVAAAAEVYMHVSPVRIPLSEAVWHAHHETPVVIWNAKESHWLSTSRIRGSALMTCSIRWIA